MKCLQRRLDDAVRGPAVMGNVSAPPRVRRIGQPPTDLQPGVRLGSFGPAAHGSRTPTMADMDISIPGRDVPSRRECLDLLTTVSVGRVVATLDALPFVVPVNFVLDGSGVVFRTTPTSRLAAATRNTVVAFEADKIDESARTGWSVVVVGFATPIVDISRLVRATQLNLVAWAPGDRDHFVHISLTQVSGRRLDAVAHLPVSPESVRAAGGTGA